MKCCMCKNNITTPNFEKIEGTDDYICASCCNKQLDKIEFPPKIIFNEKQTQFLKEFKVFLNSDKEVYLLSGLAGSGKTFVLKEALKGYNGTVIGATNSHAAKNILESALDNQYRCMTIASLLGLVKDIDDKGEIIFIPSDRPDLPIEFADLLIIDECSMISKQYHSYLLEKKKKHCKIIFVGDAKQLPPVKEEDDSVCFEYDGIELTEPMRYGGKIAELATAIRFEIEKLNQGLAPDRYIINKVSGRKNMLNEDKTGVIFTNDKYKLIDTAVEIYRNAKDSEALRFLAYKNETIETLNETIRKGLYGENIDSFVKGELIISKGGYGKSISHGSVFRIEDLKETVYEGIPCLALKLENFYSNAPIYTIDLNKKSKSYKMYNNKRKELYTIAKQSNPNWRKRNWWNYHKFVEKFAHFEYSYAITTHKAQGSTYENVIIFEGEIMSVKPTTIKQKLQTLYVGITRASKNLYIYKK